MKNCLNLLLFLLLSACSPIDSLTPFDQQQAELLYKNEYMANPAKEKIRLILPTNQHWESIDVSLYKTGRPLMLIPRNENFSNWNESIRTKIRSYAKKPPLNALEFFHQQNTEAKKVCTMVNSKILTKIPQYILYQTQFSGCQTEKNQLQIGKIFNGIDAVYTVYYSAIIQEVPLLQINRMRNVIENARLLKVKITAETNKP